jgi:hypothetical protein
MMRNPNVFVTLHAIFQTLMIMKNFRLKPLILSIVLVSLLLCSCGSKGTNGSQSEITADMAFEGVNNYCHKEYDWSVAKDNPDIMYVQMGEETDSAFQVVFRSYTGAFVHFYVNKTSGTTKMVEKVPSLNVEEEAGTINLFDYLEKR